MPKRNQEHAFAFGTSPVAKCTIMYCHLFYTIGHHHPIYSNFMKSKGVSERERERERERNDLDGEKGSLFLDQKYENYMVKTY